MPPLLLTERLRLRPPRMDDLDNIYRLGSDPRVMRYITPGRLQTLEDARTDLERRMSTSDESLGYWITEVRATGDFVGWMTLRPMEGTSLEVELGYRFCERQWGKGYATEGGARILRYGFQDLGLEKVIAVADEANRASTRVMEKLGMVFSGYGRYHGFYCVRYEILASGVRNKSGIPDVSSPYDEQR